jgi:protein-disulfide isomerase
MNPESGNEHRPLLDPIVGPPLALPCCSLSTGTKPVSNMVAASRGSGRVNEMKSKATTSLAIAAILAGASGCATAPPAPAPSLPPGNSVASPDIGKTPADLPTAYVNESDLPAGTLAGLSAQQKYIALKVANETNCDCGCQDDSIAKCRKNDETCSRAPQLLTQIVALARESTSTAQIKDRMGKKPAAPTGRSSDDLVFKVPLDDAACRGPETAKVTIVEFSDFQCPFCGRVVPTVRQVEEKYGQDLRFCFKHNPLPFHQFAAGAAEVAVEAQSEGKFWEMHDMLFGNQRALDVASLDKYAQEIGLDQIKVRSAVEDQRYKLRIQKDQALASSLGASGTPAFFINGRSLSGAQPLAKFTSLVDEEIKKADALVARGVKPADLYAEIIKNGRSSAPVVAAAPPPPSQFRKVDIASFNPVRGPLDAKVTIVEFSDFQCPFCGRVLATLKQVEETYGRDVRLVFRQQPLPFHPYAMPAAEAALAASDQGKFWEMHDQLFANQGKINAQSPMPDLERIASDVGLDMSRFDDSMNSHQFKSQVEADSKYGNTVGANGTPTFFINGRLLSGAQPFDRFKSVIDEEITKADALIKKGVKRDQLYARLLEDGAKAAPAPTPAPQPNPGARTKIDLGGAPIKGGSKAPVTIVAFSDFQCPFCNRAEMTLKTIEDTYAGKVRFAWKNKPLPFHQFAKGAAEAAMAANAQSKFWEMHDKLFANQRNLDRPDLERYAAELNLDMNRFRADLDSHKYLPAIEEEVRLGDTIGAAGTPTFFINGQILVGAQPFDAFKQVIDEALSKK